MSGTKRKASDDGAVAGPATVTPISNKILQNRLLVGLGNKGGARGSLTRCVSRIGEILLDKDSAEKKDAAIRELEHQRLEFIKLFWTVSRHEIELETLRSATELCKKRAVDESVAVQNKRKELKKQLAVNACEREYEALAKLAIERHPTSRRVLQGKLDDMVQKHEEIKSSLVKAQKEATIRQSQFQLLMQCIFDLKQSLDEPLEVSTEDEVREEEKVGASIASNNAKDAAPSGKAQMEVEATEGADEDLYGDL